MVAKLNNDSSMVRYDSMCVIPRKLFQKMLNYIWWLYFQTWKAITANYHTRFESKFCTPAALEDKKVFLSPQYHEYFIGLIRSNYGSSTQFGRFITRRKKTNAFMTVNRWKSCTWTAVEETNVEAILAVTNTI